MTTENIISLINAGYTKEEILAMESPAEQETVQEHEQEVVPDPGQEPVQPDIAAAIEAALKPMNEQIAKLTAALQASNRNAARTEPGKDVTVEKVVADFFGKPSKGGNG